MSRKLGTVALQSGFFSLLILVNQASAQQRLQPPPEFVSWLPVSDAERALAAPAVEKDAGAEVLIWRVRVSDQVLGDNASMQRVFYNYVRVKVFDEKGKAKAAQVDLVYREPGGIQDVQGRTIKADGSVIELDRKAINRRDLVRAGKRTERAISFAMPGVEPGAIIEYRWKQTEDDNRFRYVRVHFQRDLPVQKVSYYVKPLSSRFVNEQMYIMPFHCAPTKPTIVENGWVETSLQNVPALRSEPFAPSEPNVELWALLYYRDSGAKPPDKYWNEEGKLAYKKLKESLKMSDEIKAGATQAVQQAKTEDEQISALAAYLRKNVRSLDDPEVTAAERREYFEKLPKDRERNSAEIFKSGLASPAELNVAFTALVSQAGLDARLALLANRAEVQFDPKAMADRYFLDNKVVAVKQGDSWKFVDVSSKLLAPGMLPWYEEAVFALIADPKEPKFVRTVSAAPAASLDQHEAHLKLSTEGALSGEVQVSYTGHRAEEYRSELRNRSAAQREEWLHDHVGRIFPESDVTNVTLENLDDPARPVSMKYHLDAPHFAEVTGKRILFQPSVFRRAQGSPFTASDRKLAIEFPYAWKEVDQINIELPDGFDLDSADNPGGLNLGNMGNYTLQMAVRQGRVRALETHREFAFGNEGRLFVDAENYATLKKIFDAIRIRDTHSISIKAK